MLIIAFTIFILLLLIAIMRFSFFIPGTNGLPVLMYHNIDSALPKDDLNVLPKIFEQHLQHLLRKGYTTIGFSDLCAYLQNIKPLPPKPVLITFDDGHKNNYTLMYPLLHKYNCRGNLFIVSNFIEMNGIKSSPGKYISAEELQSMDPAYIEYGLHSFDHVDYNKLDEAGLEADIKKSKEQLTNLGIKFFPCFAYTYGSYPKKDPIKRNILFDVLKRNNVVAAFRIGNRVNKLPFENNLLLKRIYIRGTDSLFEFGIKLIKGRVKLFG